MCGNERTPSYFSPFPFQHWDPVGCCSVIDTISLFSYKSAAHITFSFSLIDRVQSGGVPKLPSVCVAFGETHWKHPSDNHRSHSLQYSQFRRRQSEQCRCRWRWRRQAEGRRGSWHERQWNHREPRRLSPAFAYHANAPSRLRPRRGDLRVTRAPPDASGGAAIQRHSRTNLQRPLYSGIDFATLRITHKNSYQWKQLYRVTISN